MNEDPPLCPICGGLHPAGHRDKEFGRKLDLIEAYADLQLLRNAGMRPKVVLNIIRGLATKVKIDA